MDLTAILSDPGGSLQADHEPHHGRYNTTAQGTVLHEDKRASSLRIFCPCQYFQCIENFLDSAIFARSSETPSDSLNITRQHLKNQFEKAYPWALGKGKSLPAGYILPKGKKTIWFGPTYYWIFQCST